MYIPYDTLLALIIIEALEQGAMRTDRIATGAEAAVAMIGLIAMSYAGARLAGTLVARRLREHGASQGLLRTHRWAQTGLRTLTVALFGAFATLVNWPAFLDRRLPENGFVDEVLLFLPFIAALVAARLGAYPYEREIGGRTWTRREYVAAQLRNKLFILIPWTLWRWAGDGFAHLPDAWQEALMSDPDLVWVRYGVQAAFWIAVVTLFPLAMIWVLRCKPMPHNDRRARLEAFCKRANLRYRDILIWHTGGARLHNAGVMGLVRSFRYILFTDALLATLSPAEIEAVLAHELGHIKHWHMPKFLLFSLGYLGVLVLLMSLLPLSWQNDVWALVAFPLLAFAGFFLLILGLVSRKFERQADAESALLMGTPVPLITALERIVSLSGVSRQHSDLRHGSVAGRVKRLWADGFQPGAMRGYFRYVRRFNIALCLVLLALIVPAYWLADEVKEKRQLTINRALNQGLQDQIAGRRKLAEAQYEKVLEVDDGSVVAHTALALLYSEDNQADAAFQHARKAYRRDPERLWVVVKHIIDRHHSRGGSARVRAVRILDGAIRIEERIRAEFPDRDGSAQKQLKDLRRRYGE